jgi:lipid A biosynthesis lauroyl/palmitoleoyl acyltransferase
MIPAHLLAPKHWLTWVGIACFSVLAWLPWQARRWLGKHIGDWLYHHNHKRRHVILTNLQLCFPEQSDSQREQLAQENLREYASALLDYSLLFFRPRQHLDSRSKINGLEYLEALVREEKNVILLTAHFTWLEFIPAILAKDYTLFGFSKPFGNPVLDWLVNRSRSRYSEVMFTRADGLRKVIRNLQPRKLLFFLPDEDLGTKDSLFAPFFNTPKATLTTTARIARLGNAVCVPIAIFFNSADGRYEIVIHPPLQNFPSHDPAQDTRTVNAALEKLICHNPTQYMWLLKLFRTRPTGEEKLY